MNLCNANPSAPIPPVIDPVLAFGTYHAQTVALLTQHGKELVIAPIVESALGCRIEHVNGYDTDLLGTFTRDIPRAGSQIDAARMKARVGMRLSGLSVGMASEGSFGLDPMMGVLPWNVEFLIWIDDMCGMEVVGQAQGTANFANLLAKDWAAAEAFARQWGFPEHHLVLRPEREDDSRIRKGISAWGELEATFAWALEQSPSGLVFVETDVRAHANPTRQVNIRRAAEDLVMKLRSLCPKCGTPGFWIVDRLDGLPCEGCGSPTRETRAEILGCLKCSHRVTRERPDINTAAQERCDYCNP